MKRLNLKSILSILFFILLLSPIIVTGISLFFMPESIPLHFDASGQVDIYGNKYELLILPTINFVYGVAFYLLSKISKKYNIKSILLGAAIVGMIAFNIINYFVIASAFRSHEIYAALTYIYLMSAVAHT